MIESVEGLVSILTPFLNAERFLADTIETVLGQTYGHWELLLINDGSSDASPNIASRYMQAHPHRIRLLTHVGGRTHGVSTTRNLGLTAARGEFVAMLDADDIWLPEHLAEQVPLLRTERRAGALYGRTLHWHSWSANAQDRGRDYVPRLGVPSGRLIDGRQLLSQTVPGKAMVPSPCSVLVRRSAALAVGGFEDAFTSVYTDQVFYGKLFLRFAALPIDRCSASYRQHDDSCVHMMKRTRRGRTARLAYLSWLDGYVGRNAPNAAVLRRTIRRELWRCRHPVGDYLLDLKEFARRRVLR